MLSALFTGLVKKIKTSAANKNITTEEQQLIANAKTYFENNVHGTNVGKQLSDVTDTLPGQFNPVKSLLKNADWDDAYTIKLSIGKIVVVPIQFKDSLYLRVDNNDNATQLPINNLSKLIVYTDSAKQIHAEVVTGFPDTSFINNPSGTFTGIALVQDWQGNFLRGYSYENGQIRTLTQKGTFKPQTISTDAVIAPNSEEQEILCTEKSYDVYVDGIYAYSHYENICVDIGSGGANDGGGGVGSTGYGSVAGGGSGSGAGNANSVGIFNVTRDIVTDTCLRNVVEHIMTSGAKNIITNTLNNIFAVSTKLNLTFQDSANLAPGADGNANARTRAIFSNGGINVTITLNQNYLVGASNEYIASTIVHEIIHAYLAVYPTLLGNINEHLEMGENYVNQMSAAIIDFYPNLSKTVAYSLVLDGLATFYINGSFTPPGYWDQLVANYGFNNLPNNVNNWDYEASSYKKDGDGGTRCSN